LPRRRWTWQQAGALSQRHSFGAIGGTELLVDVFDVRLHGRSADTELGADGGQRSMRGQEGQDARLGWGQRNRCSGLWLAVAVRLAGDGGATIRREPGIVIGLSG